MFKRSLLLLILVSLFLVSCGTATGETGVVPEETEVIVEPTSTALPPTPTPEPTPLPGVTVIPLESLDYGIPWLPTDSTALPMLVYYGFNVNKPPFDLPEVRQAFSLALDTEVITLVYERGTSYTNQIPATTIVPRETLSLDLYGEVGLGYDPVRAQELLKEAGYEDTSAFPEVKLLIMYISWADYPGILVQAAEAAEKMWEENLGVNVTVEVISLKDFEEQRTLIASGEYEIFEYGLWIEENDPHSMFFSLFHPDGWHNLLAYNNPFVTQLIQEAAALADPADRLPLYVELERMLSEDEVPIIPLFHCTIDASGW